MNTLWTRGGFPPSFLAPTDDASWHWREQYIRTYLERDIPGLGIRIPPLALRRFWMMLAHWLTVVIPGAADYPLGNRIHVRGLETLIGGDLGIRHSTFDIRHSAFGIRH